LQNFGAITLLVQGSNQSLYLASDALGPEKEILFFFDCVAHVEPLPKIPYGVW
jgi:hypothetical protein